VAQIGRASTCDTCGPQWILLRESDSCQEVERLRTWGGNPVPHPTCAWLGLEDAEQVEELNWRAGICLDRRGGLRSYCEFVRD
jgi:hypothetical protein